MSGHSKWSTIKHKKGAADAARGKIFSRMSKEIIMAVKQGGSDPDANARLRTAISKARSVNMPNDNITRAIKKGAGNSEKENYEEVMYEGYGYGGVAILVQCLTDNKNRTTSDVRYVFNKWGGSLGETGCVAYLFNRKGLVVYDASVYKEEEIFEIALNEGAEDVQANDGVIEVISTSDDFEHILQVFEKKKYKALQASVVLLPSSYVSHDKETNEKVMVLLEKLEEIEDVQAVSHNLYIT